MTSATTDRRQGLVGNTALKAPVTVLAAGNITLSGQQTIDGVAVLATNAAGVPDRVLCIGQTNPIDNGIWDVSTASWTRSLDANGNYDLSQGSTVLVNLGTTYVGSYWRIATSGSITIGTTPIVWAQGLSSSLQVASFLQAGAGAVARSAQDKMRDVFNVKDFGAKGDGIADDTAAIQAALTAAGANSSIYIPHGTYLLTATLNASACQTIYGDGPNNTLLRRFTDYGDTLKFASAQACTVKGIWFYHGTMHVAGDVSLTNRVTSLTAHVRIQQGQGVLIEDCWMWRMPLQIAIDQGSIIRIRRCDMQGTWDGNFVAAQEGIAGVSIGAVSYTQIVSVEQCYFGGSGSGPRNVTYTSSDTGAHVFSMVADCGNQYAVLVNQCEDLLVSNNYMGGNQQQCVMASLTAAGVNLDWRFTGNFFDGAGDAGALMYFTTQGNGTNVAGLTIANNVFNGELQTKHGIYAFNGLGVSPVITNFSITGNTFQASVGSAIMFYNARGGVVSGNMIGGYNSRNVTAGGDLTFACAAFVSTNSANIGFNGNVIGGAVNSMVSPSFCYGGISAAGVATVFERNTVQIGGETSGTATGRKDLSIVVMTAAGNYTVAGNEDVVIVNKSVGGATQVILPTGVPPGYRITVKDGKGDAATNTIQLGGTVDGALNPVYATAYVSKTVAWNGTQWNVL